MIFVWQFLAFFANNHSYSQAPNRNTSPLPQFQIIMFLDILTCFHEVFLRHFTWNSPIAAEGCNHSQELIQASCNFSCLYIKIYSKILNMKTQLKKITYIQLEVQLCFSHGQRR